MGDSLIVEEAYRKMNLLRSRKEEYCDGYCYVTKANH